MLENVGRGWKLLELCDGVRQVRAVLREAKADGMLYRRENGGPNIAMWPAHSLDDAVAKAEAQDRQREAG